MRDDLDWLMNLQLFGMKPGLGRMRQLLERFSDGTALPGTVLVGGTNGKGSTASLLAATLTAAGRRTGLFTSPHLTDIMERFVVDGRRLDQARLDTVLRRIRPAAEETGATFFEVLVLCAVLLFREAGCTAMVFEVGLGGRFDATNALEPALSVVTGVDLDHTAVLGDTVEEIARDKAFIARPGRPLLTAATGPALAVLEEHARTAGADLRVLGRDFDAELLQSGWSGNRIRLRDGQFSFEAEVALPGPHQVTNAALALQAARLLGADQAALTAGAAAVSWPGRFETVLSGDRTWLLDGAHNPAGARALRMALAGLGAKPAVLVLGLTADKDTAAVAGELAGLAPFSIGTQALLSGRALPAPDVAALLEAAGSGPAAAAADPAAAVQLALEASKPAELIVVAGSLYLLGEIRPLLTGGHAGRHARWQ